MDNSNKIIKNILMFLSYFVYEYIALFIVLLFGVKLNTNLSKSIYLIASSLIYLIFVLFMYRKELINDLKSFKFKTIFKYIPIYLLGILLMIGLNTIIYKITNTTISGNEESIRKSIKLFPIYMCFSTVIYAPLVEEIIFRKTFKNIIKNGTIFILVSGIVFGLIHISYSDNMFNELLITVPYMIMGFDFAYIYHKSNNIFTTITIHSLHNLVLLMIQFLWR